MASLVGQLVAVLAAILLLRVLLAQAGLELSLPRSAAIAVLLVLGLLAVGALRNSWHSLDVQREHNAHLTREAARAECVAVGVDPTALTGVAARIPPRERYFVRLPRPLPNNGELCMRFLLLPRLEVARPEQARYLVLWGSARGSVVGELRRAGATVVTVRPGYAVARQP